MIQYLLWDALNKGQAEVVGSGGDRSQRSQILSLKNTEEFV